LVLISDLYDDDWASALRLVVGARYDVTVVHVLSPQETSPEMEGDLRLVDDETGESVEVTVEGDALDQYASALRGWQNQLDGWCRKRGVVYVPVTTDLALAPFVTGTLRRRGVVG
jgi:hypothetical protein